MATEQQWICAARRLLQDSGADFFQVRPRSYWADFLLSLVLAYGAGSVFLLAPLGSAWQFAAYPIAIFWLYRLGSLVHEVCHLGSREMRVFKITWNLLVGVFTLSPSPFFTHHHRDHHNCKFYGTPRGPGIRGELPARRRREVGRVAICGGDRRFPACLCSCGSCSRRLRFCLPELREFVLRRGCALTLNWRYERNVDSFDRRILTTRRVALLACAAVMLVPVFLGWTRLDPPAAALLVGGRRARAESDATAWAITAWRSDGRAKSRFTITFSIHATTPSADLGSVALLSIFHSLPCAASHVSFAPLSQPARRHMII